ncbi:gp53-like domain-containing protein, partial [Burkholderia multivorans]|uniref:gp53-like domain-containing protein n=1 Tax=Burkholderia multivorans TaxID=87883 RepID=UPI002870AD2B
ENLLFLLMAPFSQKLEPPQNPGRFTPNSDGTGKSVATWPLPFPNSCLLAIPINGAGSAPGSWAAVGALTTTTGTFWSASASGVAASGQAVYYVAIGY